MKSLPTWIVLMGVGVGWGQQTSGCFVGADGKCAHDQPAPLKCGKWQHVVHWPATCDALHVQGCLPAPIDVCANDMHSVTEKEYQSLLQRLAVLEKEKR